MTAFWNFCWKGSKTHAFHKIFFSTQLKQSASSQAIIIICEDADPFNLSENSTLSQERVLYTGFQP